MTMKELSLTNTGPAATVQLGPPPTGTDAAAMNRPWLALNDSDTNTTRELYRCYLQYMRDLATKHGTEYPQRSFEDFGPWWCSLDAGTRELFERRFRKGLAGTLAESRREIEQLFRKPA